MRGNRGYNQESIQDMNRTLLINLLRKEGICARAHLSNLSMLKQATVTNIMNDFIHWGLVKEVGFLVGNKGRRSIGISINNDDFGVLGIRLGRKNYTVGLFDLSGNLVEYKRHEVEAGQKPREIFDNIKGEARELIGSAKGRKIIAVGMAIPGPYSERRGRIELMTGVSGWNEISIKEELTEDFKLPVFVEQDANAGALAQYWHKEEDYKNSVLVYVADGQGVGAGIISNGELLKGSIGVAGEIGHTTIDLGGPKCACGNYGCLENYCSSIAFTRKVNEELQPEKEYSFQEVAGMVREGNKAAVKIFLESCDRLSVGIVNIVNSFNPAFIVIGDEMAHIEPNIMLRRIKENVRERVLPEIYGNMDISMSVVSNDSMVHGAAIVAIMDVFGNPAKYFE